jgi:hypothetical protein
LNSSQFPQTSIHVGEPGKNDRTDPAAGGPITAPHLEQSVDVLEREPGILCGADEANSRDGVLVVGSVIALCAARQG